MREALRTLKTLVKREPDVQRYVASAAAIVDGLAATGRVDRFPDGVVLTMRV